MSVLCDDKMSINYRLEENDGALLTMMISFWDWVVHLHVGVIWHLTYRLCWVTLEPSQMLWNLDTLAHFLSSSPYFYIFLFLLCLSVFLLLFHLTHIHSAIL